MRGHHLSPGRGRLNPSPKWRLTPAPDPTAIDAFAHTLNLPRALAALLLQRGFQDAESARHFLRPPLDSLSDPMNLVGMSDAVELIVRAVNDRVPILIHGDYDVDGQCAAAVLTRALRMAGAAVDTFLPHRVSDGYDFGPAGLAHAQRIGAGLILTCDCGITAVEAVQAARDAGISVIVTDHHLPGARLPTAHAVVDPQRDDDRSGLTYLSGTGIAFKLVQALVDPLHLPPALPHHLLDYVALATIADVVPLVGENRTLVKHGLRVLADTRWAGLRALIETSGCAGPALRASQVGFILAPRLNAVGRLADANEGLRLLLTDDQAEAHRIAIQLDQINRERRALDQEILDQAIVTVERDYAEPQAHCALVIAGDDWHPGVVGIVASRLVERFGRPTFIIGLDGETGRGSGRSIASFDLHAALVACGDLLERYGGHRMAAGLTIRRNRVERFRERFARVARERLTPADLGPSHRVDLEISLDQATDELERWSRELEPCGMGNPGAVFGLRGVAWRNARVIGNGHLKGVLGDANGGLDAIGFGLGDRLAGCGSGPVDAAIKLERNEWNGRSALQARLVTLAPAFEGGARGGEGGGNAP